MSNEKYISSKNMKIIPKGKYEMGDRFLYGEASKNLPNPIVELTSYMIAAFPVTQYEFELYCKENGKVFYSEIYGLDLPLVNINWYECLEFCNWMSLKDNYTPCYLIDKTKEDKNNRSWDSIKWVIQCDFSKNGYRLPTNAEWEYASKEANPENQLMYSGSNKINDVAWYSENSESKLQKVCSKKPNLLGLYDMSGNISEWCWNYDSQEKFDMAHNPKGPDSGVNRILRGGSFNHSQFNCTVFASICDSAESKSQSYGFRLARTCTP